MPANHILALRRKDPLLPEQLETSTVAAAATHFSTGISIVRTHSVHVISRERTNH